MIVHLRYLPNLRSWFPDDTAHRHKIAATNQQSIHSFVLCTTTRSNVPYTCAADGDKRRTAPHPEGFILPYCMIRYVDTYLPIGEKEPP